MNKSEEWAYNLSKNSFFSIYTYVNPIGKNNKELCDVLVLCDEDIIIISVKVINIELSHDYNVDFERWNKKAIVKSRNQLNGAERFILFSPVFKTNDGISINLPSKKNIYKIALVIGSLNKFPIFQDVDDINIWDEKTFHSIITELDTIKDFIEYLDEKKLGLKDVKLIGQSEEDLLALYLQQELSFKKNSLIKLDKNMYEDLQKETFYIQQKKEMEISYKWDVIIKNLTKNYLTRNSKNESSFQKIRDSVYVMAQETRLSRKYLVESLNQFIESSSRSRIVYSRDFGHVIYVFLSARFRSIKERIQELELRMFLSAFLYNKDATIIGIFWEQESDNEAIYDVIHHSYKGIWNDKMNIKAIQIINKLGYFKDLYNNSFKK